MAAWQQDQVTSLLVLRATLNGAPDDLLLLAPVKQVVTLLLILSLTWAAVRLTSVIGDVIVLLNPVLEGQWKRARRVETQTRFLVRCLNVLILIVGIGAALMTFEPVQKVGASQPAGVRSYWRHYPGFCGASGIQ